MRTRAPLLAVTLLLAGAGVVALADDGEPPEVTRIRAMVPELTAELERMRGLEFDRPVDVRYQSDEDFRAWLQERLDEDYPPEKAEKEVKLLAAVGLLPSGYDLRAEVVEMMSSQAMAYYDPARGAFFILKTEMPPEMLAPVVLHELQHALQDQKYDLKTALERFSADGFDRSDEALAYRFLMEGEATYLMTKFSLDQMGQGAMLEMALRMQATLPRSQLSAMERQQAMMMGEEGKSMLAALDARDKLPGYLYHNLVSPYMQGAYFVHQLVKRDGLEGLNAIFRNPPTSTAQVLHPLEALGAERREPVRLELPDLSEALGDGWSLLARDTLGEVNVRVVFEELSGDPQASAAAGWAGDRIHAYGKAGQEWASFAWALTFQSEAGAQRFADTLGTHKGKGPAPLAGADVAVDGRDVLVVGGVAAERLEAVKSAAWAGLERGGAAVGAGTSEEGRRF